jgi:CYTH domain-containing protein
MRAEFEYGIPLSDVERMLSTICHDEALEKQGLFVEDGDVVDLYGGILEGLVIAEIGFRRSRRRPSGYVVG